MEDEEGGGTISSSSVNGCDYISGGLTRFVVSLFFAFGSLL